MSNMKLELTKRKPLRLKYCYQATKEINLTQSVIMVHKLSFKNKVKVLMNVGSFKDYIPHNFQENKLSREM